MNQNHSGTRSLVWRKTNGKCWYCGCQTIPWKSFCINHFVPIKSGGGNDLPNLVPCCRRCNTTKASLILSEFRRQTEDRIQDKTRKAIATLENNGVKVASVESSSYVFCFEKESWKSDGAAVQSLIQNTTQVPNFILDELLPKLSPSALKALLVIVRIVFGFPVEAHLASNDDIMEQAGIDRASNASAIKELKELGVIRLTPPRDTAKWDPNEYFVCEVLDMEVGV